MSETLGEQLRQAREEKGFTLSEVSEQTRISSLYLESIENDDYRILPGGIFNKGFVKSYAKFVGISEQDALAGYANILARSETVEASDTKQYKPEVLTDDNSSQSMAPTIIFAVVILALMSGAILFGVSYLRQPAEPATSANTTKPANANAQSTEPSANANVAATTTAEGVPDMATVKIEFRTVSQPVRLIATNDGVKSDSIVSASSAAMFEPKESLTLNYNRWNAQAVQLTINGKPIALPAEPLPDSADKRRIEFTINKDNIAQIWTTGAISSDVPATTPAAAATAAAANTAPASTPPPTAETAATPPPASPAAQPAATPRPRVTGNTNAAPRPTPAPRSTVIVIPSANKP